MNKNVEAFNVKSNDYKTYRPGYPAALFEVLCRLSKSFDAAWDCACGTGQVASVLAQSFIQVEASDVNESQIKSAVKKKNISYKVQDSSATDYADNQFDLVCVAQALHWFANDAYFNEVKRVLKTEGLFACFGYSFFRISPEIDALIKEHILDPLKPYWSDKNKILWNHYRDINFPFTKVDTPLIEMNELWDKHDLMSYIQTWSAYRLYQQDNKADIINCFLDKVQDLWPDNHKMKIQIDFTLYLGRN